VRKLLPVEEERLQALTGLHVDVTLIEPTSTGLGKAIMDATAMVRRYLKDRSIHDFDTQKQGQEYKVLVEAELLSSGIVIPSRASLYRPTTKKGDPRIWFTGLPTYASANDILAITVYEQRLYVINLTQIPVVEIVNQQKSGPIWDLVFEINQVANQIADELLGKLRIIAGKGLVQSVLEQKADTAIGRTLETALGIRINSSRQPDYKGIEIKSFRSAKKGRRQNRKVLFAKVANWELSKFKSSQEILDNFGYERNGKKRLNCEVSTRVKNSQGLKFRLDHDADRLIETSDKAEIVDFAVWLMNDLRSSLLVKHNETFWVSADSHIIDGREHFAYKNVIHTSKPIASQFDILVDQGIITMDHLISRDSTGHAKEKGPLFKIESNALELLFPPSKRYSLQEI